PVDHLHGYLLRHDDHRSGRHRDRLRLARDRPACLRGDPGPGLSRRADRRSGHHRIVHPRQPAGRHPLCHCRPQNAEPRLMRSISVRIALGLLLLFAAVAVAGPWLTPYDPLQGSLRARLVPPVWQEGGSWEHLFGTDRLGRDVLSRIIAGARISLFVCLLVIAIAGSVGTAIGTIAGYYGGWLDRLLMRLVDLALSLPVILLALLIGAISGPSFGNIVLVISLVLWSQYARMARGETMRIRHEDYVDLARTSGLHDFWIIIRHVLPNIAPSLI